MNLPCYAKNRTLYDADGWVMAEAINSDVDAEDIVQAVNAVGPLLDFAQTLADAADGEYLHLAYTMASGKLVHELKRRGVMKETPSMG